MVYAPNCLGTQNGNPRVGDGSSRRCKPTRCGYGRVVRSDQDASRAGPVPNAGISISGSQAVRSIHQPASAGSRTINELVSGSAFQFLTWPYISGPSGQSRIPGDNSPLVQQTGTLPETRLAPLIHWSPPLGPTYSPGDEEGELMADSRGARRVAPLRPGQFGQIGAVLPP